jgi:hypothetical protein
VQEAVVAFHHDREFDGLACNQLSCGGVCHKANLVGGF